MRLRILVGIIISFVFIFLAFRKVDFQEMWDALRNANYLWLIPSFLAMLLSHVLRAWRWQYFMAPVKSVRVHALFSSLMIGYAANNIFPLRLGEFLRAYAVGKTQNISKTSAFATVLVERLVDVLSLLLLLAFTVFVFPLPQSIKNWGYILSVLTVGVIVVVVLLMEKTDRTINFLEKILPEKIFNLVQRIVRSFLEGFMVFKKSEHYLAIIGLSFLVWALYATMVYISFFAFDFQISYNLNFYSSLVLLVIVSIGIMIPSSPGFVGTYHWFCMQGLALYGVSRGEALSFAVISHALNTIPFTAVGLIYFWKENLRFSDAVAEKELVEKETEKEELSG